MLSALCGGHGRRASHATLSPQGQARCCCLSRVLAMPPSPRPAARPAPAWRACSSAVALLVSTGNTVILAGQMKQRVGAPAYSIQPYVAVQPAACCCLLPCALLRAAAGCQQYASLSRLMAA